MMARAFLLGLLLLAFLVGSALSAAAIQEGREGCNTASAETTSSNSPTSQDISNGDSDHSGTGHFDGQVFSFQCPKCPECPKQPLQVPVTSSRPLDPTPSENTLTSCKGVESTDGKYKIVNINDNTKVVCDTETDNGGWTVILRRMSNDVGFDRNWEAYKNGFGDYNGSFWYGLEKLYQWTHQARYELRVDMTYQGMNYYAKYSHFKVGAEAENYVLEVFGYNGTAGDSFTYHNGSAFSTYDADNDRDETNNCVAIYTGGWWYKGCHSVHLTGLWASKENAKGINWGDTSGYDDSLSWVEMKIRPLV